ncbi:MAG: hypothetical protein JWL88_382 [Parcubacteria group bacterium]|nr:hypothetical protein [Parcubacteria group bacterium]
MSITFSLSVYERRNPENVVECVYLVHRGKGASAHSRLDWAVDALVEEMRRLKETQVLFDEQTHIKYDRIYDENGGYGLKLHRPFKQEERKQIWEQICRLLSYEKP